MAHPTDEILRAMQSPTAENRRVIQKAYDCAEKAHGSEKRKSGEPYIIHPAAIAHTLAELGMDQDTIVAGILHDTIEDTSLTADEIEKEFGKDVRFLVEGVTKLSKLKYRGLERHVESLRRLLVATAADIRVIIIKLADRLHNMQTLQYVDEHKQLRIAEETMEIYVPIAERLGMGVFKTALQDLAFKVIDPDGYKQSLATMAAKRTEMEEALEEAVRDIKKSLGSAGIRSFKTETRVKSAYSFAKKLEKRHGDVDRIYDLFAIRIVVPTVEDCYKVMGIVHTIWRPIPGRIKDYIAYPKPNGYRSLHTAVITNRGLTVEIQVRTEEMQRESQFGVASHFNYKSYAANKGSYALSWFRRMMPQLVKAPTATTPAWLKELSEVLEESDESLTEALKHDFFAERIFTFTPKADAIDLPAGATPVDFAYAVHSDLGDMAVGARVNGKMVSLDTPLHNGDAVEIVTKKSGTPNRKWLEFVKTTGARKHIRAALLKSRSARR